MHMKRLCGRAAVLGAAMLLSSFAPSFVFGVQAKEHPAISAWVAYWDLTDGQRELRDIRKKAAQVSYFGAYFNAEDRLFVPRELREAREAQRQAGERYETYLTVVNDRQDRDTATAKDLGVLRRVLASGRTQAAHADEIVALAKDGGYTGIELDYERVWRDREIGANFMMFLETLYQKAAASHLKMRVVLEPETPFRLMPFAEGPEYVVMLYNLYGVHSGPGPKTEPEFIRKTLRKLAVLPGRKNAAFSLGGCLWSSDGQKRFLTENEARALAGRHKAKLKRDENSRCQVFSYVDGAVKYDVWYADKDTLNYWISIAKEEGICDISLWRLGGNRAIKKIG